MSNFRCRFSRFLRNFAAAENGQERTRQKVNLNEFIYFRQALMESPSSQRPPFEFGFSDDFSTAVADTSKIHTSGWQCNVHKRNHICPPFTQCLGKRFIFGCYFGKDEQSAKMPLCSGDGGLDVRVCVFERRKKVFI